VDPQTAREPNNLLKTKSDPATTEMANEVCPNPIL